MPSTRSAGPRLAAGGVHAAWFLVPVVGVLLVALVLRLRGGRDGFVRLHVQAALRVQLAAGAGVALLVVVANTVLYTDERGTNGLAFLLVVALGVWASVVAVLWIVDASEARPPRRADPLTRALVPHTDVA